MLWRHLSHEPATKEYPGKLHILKPVSSLSLSALHLSCRNGLSHTTLCSNTGTGQPYPISHLHTTANPLLICINATVCGSCLLLDLGTPKIYICFFLSNRRDAWSNLQHGSTSCSVRGREWVKVGCGSWSWHWLQHWDVDKAQSQQHQIWAPPLLSGNVCPFTAVPVRVPGWEGGELEHTKRGKRPLAAQEHCF